MKHGQIIFGLFGPADEQVTEPIKPGVCPLNDPAVRFLPRFFGLYFFPPRADVGRVAQGRHNFAHLLVVIARVQAQALLATRHQVGLPGRLSGGR
jgi:hypothetical protein